MADTYIVFGWGEWNGMECNGMSKNTLKLIKIGRKFWKKIEEVQNCYDEIWEEIEDEREWSIPSQSEGVNSSTWCKEWNGGMNEIS